MASKLDAILWILHTMVPRQPSLSSASTKSPPMPPLLPKVTNLSSSSAKPPPTAETTPHPPTAETTSPQPTAETTLPPLPMATSHLPHHALSSDPLPTANNWSHTKPRDILPFDIRFSLSVVCATTVRDTNLHHPFLLLFTILVAAKGLCLRPSSSTNSYTYFHLGFRFCFLHLKP
ncbi:hypothetical protein HKD37_10G030035 [Glycine soja]